MRGAVVCAICKQKNLPIDFSKIKSKKIKNFINNNHINKEDYSSMLKKCNCNKSVHKFCILLNILFNFELKCPDCNCFYNVAISKRTNNSEKIKIIILMSFLILLHLVLYGCCVILIIFNINKFQMNDFTKIREDKYIHIQYFFALILFILNSYLLYRTIRSIMDKLKHSYQCSINISERNASSKIDDSKYFEPLYYFYRSFNNDRLSYLVCKRNEIFFSNKINYTKDFQNFIKNNNLVFQDLSNGNQFYNNYNNNKVTDNEDLLKLNNSNTNNKHNKNNSSGLLKEEEKN